MFRKLHFFQKTPLFLSILLLSFVFCFTNTFADENGDPIDIEKIIAEGNFAFPTPDGEAYIQDTPEFQKILENIIGSNDIEKMRDLPPESQDYILGTKVGMIFIPSRFDPDRGFVCTGFLVGPDLFMTNHHCIHDEFGPLPLREVVILMDYYQDRDVDRTLGGVTAGVSEVLREDGLKDYALLRLDKPIGDTYGWLELDTTTVPDPSQSVKLISHNLGRSKEIVRRNSEIVELPTDLTDEFPFLLAYLADSQGGASGSPVFLREGTGVIAIHHSAWSLRDTGEPVFNAGSLMSYIVPEIRQWLPDNTTPPSPALALDVNGDGQVDVLDLVWVAVSYGMRGDALPADVNADGVVNVQDLVAVAAGIDAGAALPAKVAEEVLLAAEAAAALEGVAGAPVMGFNAHPQVASGLTAYRNVAAAFADVKHLATDDVRLGKWMPMLEELLHRLAEMREIPDTTALLPNYPNPFNPETWIPYQLAQRADVTLRIYSVDGSLVRTLSLGHQPAGMYQNRARAAYWDGRNEIGEPVASGVYFYTLTAGEFTATRRLLIVK